MKTISSYLNMLQEQQYNPTISTTKIHGDFQDQWSTCYTKKCTKEEDRFRRAYCKTTCIISSINNAISKVNGELSKCSQASQPKRCIDSLKNIIKNYQEQIKKAREVQDKISAREAEFKRQSG